MQSLSTALRRTRALGHAGILTGAEWSSHGRDRRPTWGEPIDHTNQVRVRRQRRGAPSHNKLNINERQAMSNALAEAAESATLAILDLREALIRGNYSPKANSERRMIELSRSDIRRAQSKRTTP